MVENAIENNEPEDRHSPEEEQVVGLIASNQSALLAHAIALMPNHSDAEDMLQRTNIILWRKRDRFKLGTNFGAWAFTVMRLEARKFYSKRKEKNWLIFDDEVASMVGDHLAEMPFRESSVRAEALRMCLNRLSVPHRQLVLDRYQAELTVAECASKMERSEGGLRVTIHRLRSTLRKCVEKYVNREGYA